MRKRRGWLIGLGIGLMLGASMLQLMNVARAVPSSMTLPSEPPSREELDQEAADKGLKLIQDDGQTYTQEELDAAVAQAKQDAAAQAPSPSAASGAAPSSASAAGEQPAELDFYVRPSASLQEVASALEAMGLIADKDAFIQAAKPYSGKIRVGLCRFAGQPTTEEIIAELTRAKN